MQSLTIRNLCICAISYNFYLYADIDFQIPKLQRQTIFGFVMVILILFEDSYLKFLWQTFNDFFIRELKPGSRPIDSIERDDVAVCAADCRLMAFKSVDDSLRFWIKVFFNLFYTECFHS